MHPIWHPEAPWFLDTQPMLHLFTTSQRSPRSFEASFCLSVNFVRPSRECGTIGLLSYENWGLQEILSSRGVLASSLMLASSVTDQQTSWHGWELGGILANCKSVQSKDIIWSFDRKANFSSGGSSVQTECGTIQILLHGQLPFLSKQPFNSYFPQTQHLGFFLLMFFCLRLHVYI